MLDAYVALGGEGGRDMGGYEREVADVASRAAGAVVLVAEVDGRAVGCVTYVPDLSSPYAEDLQEGEAGIRMLGVAPDAWGGGAGRALVEACIERARADGRTGVFLHSTPLMTRAHGLYERLGFRRVPERDWNPGVELLAFRLDL